MPPAPPPSMAELERLVAAFALALYPDAAGASVTVEVPDAYGELRRVELPVRLLAPAPPPPADVPAPPDLSQPQEDILAELSRYKPGEWVKGTELAKSVSQEANGGGFRRLVGSLVRAGLVQSDRKGYRLTIGTEPHDPE